MPRQFIEKRFPYMGDGSAGQRAFAECFLRVALRQAEARTQAFDEVSAAKRLAVPEDGLAIAIDGKATLPLGAVKHRERAGALVCRQ